MKICVGLASAAALLATIFSLQSLSDIYSDLAVIEMELAEEMKEFNDISTATWVDISSFHLNPQLNSSHPLQLNTIFERKKRFSAQCQCSVTSRGCPAGPPGQPGQSGKQGEDGHPGRDGRDGVSGVALQVTFDLPGGCIQCPPGISGQPGVPGMEGAQGKCGRSGRPGEVGFYGPDGEEGLPGEQGAKGEDGEAGRRGHDGFPGIMFEIGEPGRNGYPGFPGQSGRSGNFGENGVDGKRGCSGLPGVQGIKGIRGSRGVDGESGCEGKYGKNANYCDCPKREKEDGKSSTTKKNPITRSPKTTTPKPRSGEKITPKSSNVTPIIRKSENIALRQPTDLRVPLSNNSESMAHPVTSLPTPTTSTFHSVQTNAAAHDGYGEYTSDSVSTPESQQPHTQTIKSQKVITPLSSSSSDYEAIKMTNAQSLDEDDVYGDSKGKEVEYIPTAYGSAQSEEQVDPAVEAVEIYGIGEKIRLQGTTSPIPVAFPPLPIRQEPSRLKTSSEASPKTTAIPVDDYGNVKISSGTGYETAKKEESLDGYSEVVVEEGSGEMAFDGYSATVIDNYRPAQIPPINYRAERIAVEANKLKSIAKRNQEPTVHSESSSESEELSEDNEESPAKPMNRHYWFHEKN